MKSMTIKALAVTLPLAFGTAFADSQTVFDGTDKLVPMNDTELQLVTGTGDFCAFCYLSNSAYVGQANVSGLSAFVYQSNGSSIHQNNN